MTKDDDAKKGEGFSLSPRESSAPSLQGLPIATPSEALSAGAKPVIDGEKSRGAPPESYGSIIAGMRIISIGAPESEPLSHVESTVRSEKSPATSSRAEPAEDSWTPFAPSVQDDLEVTHTSLPPYFDDIPVDTEVTSDLYVPRSQPVVEAARRYESQEIPIDAFDDDGPPTHRALESGDPSEVDDDEVLFVEPLPSPSRSDFPAREDPTRPSRPPLVIIPPHGGAPSPLAPPPMNEAVPQRRRARPWWEELFNDDFIRTMAKMSDERIAAEANFIEESLGVAKGAMVLDLACGTGRHAIELTRRGYQVVGFDFSLAMLARAADEAQERHQRINFVQGDMREMTFEDTFDGVFCWNTSFGFFEEEKNAAVITNVHRALRKGGQFLLDVANRDFVLRQSPSLVWFEGEGCVCMDEMQVDWITSRMRVKRTMMMDDTRTKEIEYSIRLYSLHELGKVLHDYGFRVVEVSGRISMPGVFFGDDSPRTLILAEKR